MDEINSHNMKGLAILGAAALILCSCGTARYSTEERDQIRVEKAREGRERMENEVVGDGYGTYRKSENTTAIQREVPNERVIGSYSNIVEYLRGRVPGLQIGPSDGASMPSMTIRGKNSINSDTQPLFIVDGVQTDNIMWINPNDVASVDVLKDGSAAIYGVRAANGVIIITTKTGEEHAAAEQTARKEARKAAKAERKSNRK